MLHITYCCWIIVLLISECIGQRTVAVRLVGGENANEGRVEVYYKGAWATVCDDSWDDNCARVVCRQLGLPTGGAKALVSAHFGQGSGVIVLEDVECSGSEASLNHCSINEWETDDCGHDEDAGVQCLTTSYPEKTCPTGYDGDTCQNAICTPMCSNGGTCIHPNQCACPESYGGNRCETDASTHITKPIMGDSDVDSSLSDADDSRNQLQDAVLSIWIKGSCIVLGLVLFAVIVILSTFGKWRHRIALQFCLSLFLLNLVFVYWITLNTSYVSCKTVAVLLQYFLLSTFSWVGVEITDIHFCISQKNAPNKVQILMYFIAWGLPLVVIFVTLGAGFHSYKDFKICFPANVPPLYSGVYLTIGAVYLHDVTTLFICALCRLWGAECDKNGDIMKRLQNTFTIFILLGLTILFAFLSVAVSCFIYSLVLCVLTIPLGVAVFVLFCMWQDDVKKRVNDQIKSAVVKLRDTVTTNASKTKAIATDIASKVLTIPQYIASATKTIVNSIASKARGRQKNKQE